MAFRKTMLMAGTAIALFAVPSFSAAQQQFEDCVEYRDSLMERLGQVELNDDDRNRINGILREAGEFNEAGDQAQCVAKLDEVDAIVVAMIPGAEPLNLQRELGAVTATQGTDTQETQELQAQQQEQDPNLVTQGVAGGQIQVEQRQPEVNVAVPEPEVRVTQPQPEVFVTQGEPEIIVRQQPPQVEVRIPEPVVTVRQVEPEIIVRIPEPVVEIRQAKPQVDVNTPQPQVEVETFRPQISFQQPQPRIQFEQAEPEVNVATDEPRVSVERAEAAQVQIEKAEPEVTLQQGGEAEVAINRAQPEVNVQEAEGANVQVERTGEAQVEVSQAEQQPAEQQMAASEQQGEATATTTASSDEEMLLIIERHPFYQLNIDDIVGTDVYGLEGEDVGEIKDLATRGNMVYAIIEAGGFLGIGEREVAFPIQDLQMQGDRVTLNMTEEQVEELGEYNADEYQLLPRGETFAGAFEARELQ